MNKILLTGRLTKDPETRFTKSGTMVTNFFIAIDRIRKATDGSTVTDFIPIEVYGKTADFCSKYLKKGYLISAEGELHIERYVKDEENRTYTKVIANRIEGLARVGSSNVNTEVPATFAATEDEDVPF